MCVWVNSEFIVKFQICYVGSEMFQYAKDRQVQALFQGLVCKTKMQNTSTQVTQISENMKALM